MPSQSPSPDRPSRSPRGWGGKVYTELPLPSGDTCVVKRVNPTDLLAPTTDQANVLGTIVAKKLKQAQETGAAPVQSAIEGLDETLDAMSTPGAVTSLVDQVVVAAVVEPRVYLPPERWQDRDDELIYIDAVPFEDKMAIFDWAMKGMDNLKSFRGASPDAVGAVENVHDVSLPTE